MNPKQDVYNMIYDICGQLGEVKESWPKGENIFPVIIMGSTQLVPSPNKSIFFGTVFQRIDIFAKANQKGTLNQLMVDIDLAIRQRTQSDNYSIRVKNSDMRDLLDSSTNMDLNHGIMNIEIEIF